MSDDQEAVSHLRDRLELITRERRTEHALEAGAITRRAAAAGRFASGNTISELQRQAVADLRIRSELFVRALGETWTSYRPSLAAAEEAHTIVKDALQAAVMSHDMCLRDSGPAQNFGQLPETIWEQFQSNAADVEQRLALRLREWLLQMRRAEPTSPSNSQTTTVHLTGNNNTVIAGLIGSNSNIQIDNLGSEKILSALENVKLAIETTRSLPEQDASDAIEMIGDAKAELARQQPNKRKLAASLQGIATTIQTKGALSYAYGVLKAAMALIGLPLP